MARDDAEAMRAAGFDLVAEGQVVKAVSPDGGSTYYVGGVKIAHHRSVYLDKYTVSNRHRKVR